MRLILVALELGLDKVVLLPKDIGALFSTRANKEDTVISYVLILMRNGRQERMMPTMSMVLQASGEGMCVNALYLLKRSL